MHLDPSDANVRHLLARSIEGPVVMVNLLRFRDVADYTSHPELAPDEPISGREAYDRYVEHTLPFLLASGGTVRFSGSGGHVFIGPDDERWDEVLLVEQADIGSFFAFADDPAYTAGLGHRSAALADNRLIPVVERPVP